MSISTRSDFVDFIRPLGERLAYYDRGKPSTNQPRNDAADPARNLPSGFIDAMTVREEVFVKEQGVPLENELDDDDVKSFHWVAYASLPSKASSPEVRPQGQPNRRVSTSTKIPIGYIRLVLPPHPPHPKPGSQHKADALDIDNDDDGTDRTAVHDGREQYIKLGRLAVIKEFRKAGISRLLIDTALTFAREHPNELTPYVPPTQVEAAKAEMLRGVDLSWRGLVLVHAQTGVQKVWRRYGFETDESMGVWEEEGIEHVGMWRRLDVTAGRRNSKFALHGMT